MAAMRAAGDDAIGCKVRQVSHALAARGHIVHEYLFTTTPTRSLNYQNLSQLGAFHGAEEPFAFGDGFELATPAERALATTMGCYWRNFAHSGDPNVGAAPNAAPCGVPWPRFGKKPPAQATLVLGTNASSGGVHVTVGLKKSQCKAFHPTEEAD